VATIVNGWEDYLYIAQGSPEGIGPAWRHRVIIARPFNSTGFLVFILLQSAIDFPFLTPETRLNERV
jgi:hypothetical protein